VAREAGGRALMEIVKSEVAVQTGSEKMPCHLARPAGGGPYPGIVVVMEAFGLNDNIKNVTGRFASEGFAAIAPNLYFRQPNNVVACSDLPGAFRLMGSINDEQVLADMTAAIDYLKGLKEVKPNIGVAGFCMGGRITFLTACRNPDVKAAVPFYGGGMVSSRQPGAKPPIEYVAGLKAPVLAFFGGKDQFIPLADVDKFRDELKKAGKAAEVVLYADADHGFMCEERPSHHPTHAKEAWAKTIAFFKQRLA
jgi:carboxymethylenebutenolidase